MVVSEGASVHTGRVVCSVVGLVTTGKLTDFTMFGMMATAGFADGRDMGSPGEVMCGTSPGDFVAVTGRRFATPVGS
jgi:hypothetical protein